MAGRCGVHCYNWISWISKGTPAQPLRFRRPAWESLRGSRGHAQHADARDVRFGRAGTVSFESLPSEFCQNSVRNHQNSARILGIEVEKHRSNPVLRKNHPEQEKQKTIWSTSEEATDTQ